MRYTCFFFLFRCLLKVGVGFGKGVWKRCLEKVVVRRGKVRIVVIVVCDERYFVCVKMLNRTFSSAIARD